MNPPSGSLKRCPGVMFKHVVGDQLSLLNLPQGRDHSRRVGEPQLEIPPAVNRLAARMPTATATPAQLPQMILGFPPGRQEPLRQTIRPPTAIEPKLRRSPTRQEYAWPPAAFSSEGPKSAWGIRAKRDSP